MGLGLLLLAAALTAAEPTGAAAQVRCRLSKIDEGHVWVTPYWGYNAPHLVYDGEAFYAVGLWGEQEAESRGAVYRSDQDGKRWTRGFTWDTNYQPPLLLLDSERRVLLISPQAGSKPKIFRAQARGKIQEFTPIAVPDTIPRAGYVGAGIYNDRLVLAYNGSTATDPVRGTYDFSVAWLDLKTLRWSEPVVVAPAQRAQEPWTTWLYPVVQPDADGIHVLVNNNPRGSVYDRAWYLVVPWEARPGYQPRPERVAPADTARDFIIHMDYMHRQPDGTIYVTGRYQPAPGTPVQLALYRRDAATGQWSERKIDETPGSDVNFLHGAITQLPGDPHRLWVLAAYSTELRLYRSSTRGDTWQRVELPDFKPYGWTAASYLYLIYPSSGSVTPPGLCANFNEGVTPHKNYAGHYRLWMAQVEIVEK